MLPDIPYPKRTKTYVQTAFAGLDRREGAANGAIAAMTNLTGALSPLLSTRRKRRLLPAGEGAPHGLFAVPGVRFAAWGTTLAVTENGETTVLTDFSDTDKVFAALGERVLVWPDKRLVRRGESAWEAVPLSRSVTVSATFADGTYAGEAAEGNTLLAADAAFDWSDFFSVGDAVTISGAADEANNKTPVVREIEGNALRFYEHTFTVNPAAASITVAREVPDLDFLCVNENRVWGCRGDTVRCSKLGDPFNWNVFDGLSTDAWSWDTGTAGSFTGCVSFLGYPCFFKEGQIFKVYGSRPANFEAMSAATLGVVPGGAKSLAVAGETLYYLSRAGFCAYTGGIPSPVGAALGEGRHVSAVAGSDGGRYVVSAENEAGEHELLVYDPRTKLWHREDGFSAHSMAFSAGGVLAMSSAGLTFLTRPTGDEGAEEGDFESSVTFAAWDYESFESKYPARLWLRLACSGDMTVEIRYDNGDWLTSATLTSQGKRTEYVPVPIRRCDRYALRLTGTAPWTLYALQWEFYASQRNRKPI